MSDPGTAAEAGLTSSSEVVDAASMDLLPGGAAPTTDDSVVISASDSSAALTSSDSSTAAVAAPAEEVSSSTASSALSGVDSNLVVTEDQSGQILNAKRVRCKVCSCLILSERKAELVIEQKALPHMAKKSDRPANDAEELNQYWLVRDIYTFENIGCTKPLDGIKYLICADCEVGPIGWYYENDLKRLYVALERVRHE